MSDLDALVVAWKREFPRHASGGIYALRGFRFQLLCALRDAVCAWVETPREIPNFFVEKLSDIVGIRYGEIVITQVKRTGTSSRLREALEELWSIHELAARHTPDLLRQLRFRVRCARWHGGVLRNSELGFVTGVSGQFRREF